MEKLVVNGVELELDLMDADVLERFQALVQQTTEKFQNKDYTGMTQPEGMRWQCRTIEEFFDDLFGAGTSLQVFGEGNNHHGQHIDAYGYVCHHVDNVQGEYQAIADKYSPNRAQALPRVINGSANGSVVFQPQYNRSQRRHKNNGKRR